ncbi:a-factor receptor [Coccidioides posadasii str. Silveira]|uniref:a-factor receptor n=1 Tax=Coccidioides posadasii (strain RMSCC 757 / Silveira) TaxID=443226 RepID=UPI001BEEE920|nr:a-factor receptor [Coccidioides posadasii str. Silveira]
MSEIQPSLERSPEGVALSVFAFLSILVCFPPLLWHSRNKNFPAVCLTVWLIVQNIFNFINPLVWPTDDIPSWWDGRGYCDIQAKLITGAGVGIAGPLACIFRSLAKVLDTEHATIMPSKGEKRRTLAFDISFCVIIPAFVMAIHYIVQERRYFIYAIVGCMPSYISSWPSIIVNHMWAPLVLTVAVVYAVIVVYRLIKYKREFNYIISVSSSTNKSRFMRLFILSMVLLLGSYPVQIYVLFFNITGFGPLLPFSWAEVHGPEWQVIEKYPMGGKVFFDRWIHVTAGFLLFAFFGFGKDATLMYRSFLLKLGLGRLFPGLQHPHIMGSGHGSSRSKGGSLGSRTRIIFRGKSEDTTTMSTVSKPDESSSMSIGPFISSDSGRRSPSFSLNKPASSHLARTTPNENHSTEPYLSDIGNILQVSPPRPSPQPGTVDVRTSFPVSPRRGDDMV